MTTSCKRCQKTLTFYQNHFLDEYLDAKRERDRLHALFMDVCWYNFETACKSWKRPWAVSDPDSLVSVSGVRHSRWYNKGKLKTETRSVPYYRGTLRNAPALPPAIVLSEVKAANRYVIECEGRLDDATDWAPPHGRKYKQLLETTLVGKQISQRTENE